MTDKIHPCNFRETKSSYTTYARTVSSTFYSFFSFSFFFLQHFVKTFASKPKQGIPFFSVVSRIKRVVARSLRKQTRQVKV